MNTIIALLVETAILIALVGIIPLIVLAFRDPFRPSWLKRSGIDDFATIMIVMGVCFSVAFEITGLIGVGLSPFVSLAVVPAVVFGVGTAIWRLIGFGERLRRADAGQSPFGRHGRDVPGIPLGA